MSTRKAGSGRKQGTTIMTRNRQRILAAYADMAASGETVRLAEIARRCGLYSYRNARRTVRDLRRLGAL